MTLAQAKHYTSLARLTLYGKYYADACVNAHTAPAAFE